MVKEKLMSYLPKITTIHLWRILPHLLNTIDVKKYQDAKILCLEYCIIISMEGLKHLHWKTIKVWIFNINLVYYDTYK